MEEFCHFVFFFSLLTLTAEPMHFDDIKAEATQFPSTSAPPSGPRNIEDILFSNSKSGRAKVILIP